jgi:hypothetical protein
MTPKEGDCDDWDPNTYKGAQEQCDGKDNSCDGEIDEDCTFDGWKLLCAESGGEWSDCSGLCTIPNCRSAAADPIPCDATVCIAACLCPAEAPYWEPIQGGCVPKELCEGGVSADEDFDGYPSWEDCDDFNANVFPGNVESCDGIDNNCDGMADEGCNQAEWPELCAETGGNWEPCVATCGLPSCQNPEPIMCLLPACIDGCACPADKPLWEPSLGGCIELALCDGPQDKDGDGFSPPQDCDDSDALKNPIAPEFCDGVDNDCDGSVDEGCSPDELEATCKGSGGTWAECVPVCPLASCDNPEPEPCALSACSENCLCPPAKPLWEPALGGCVAASACEGRPLEDEDGDGYDLDDCNDQNADVYPGAVELCNSIDDDCDGDIDEAGCESPLPALCESTGGTYNPCGSDCDPGVPCPDVCVEQCECGENAPIWNDELGCVAIEEPPTWEELCEDTGGAVECISNCPEGEVCPAVCEMVCVCPDGFTFDDSIGCAEGMGGDESTGDDGGESTGDDGGESTGDDGGESSGDDGGDDDDDDDGGGGCSQRGDFGSAALGGLAMLALALRRRRRA